MRIWGSSTYSADGPHGMVDASWAKSTLDDLEPAPFAQNYVAHWDPDVVEADMSVSMRGIIVAIDVQHTVNSHALGVCRNKDNGLLAIGVLVLWV